MTASPSRPARSGLRIADLRGAAQLATAATLGLTQLSEGVHQSVLGTLGLGARSATRTAGLTGLVYGSIRGVARLLGTGADLTLRHLQLLLDKPGSDDAESPRRAALLAALNGLIGDRLAASGSPLATTMSLRRRAGSSAEPGPTALSPLPACKLLLLVHGLCMDDRCWSSLHQGQPADHGQALAAALGFEPLALRCNSGQTIAQNGLELSALLEQVLAQSPTPVESLSVIAHSMGGLVMRSALVQAQRAGRHWPKRLRHIVFLGTPHHGAPLERAGHWLELLLGAVPYSAPFVRLTGLRSAGISDLRHGRVLDDDSAVPLPDDVACFTIAASTRSGAWAQRLLGDGLVPVASALGRHPDPRRALHFEADTQRILPGMNHLQLLSRPEVTQQLIAWLRPGHRQDHRD